MQQQQKPDTEKLAGRTYNPENESKSDEITQGLAETHQQVNDYYIGVTMDGQVDKGKSDDKR